MRFIKECAVRILEALVILAFIYVMMDSWDGSVAFNDERVAQQRAECQKAKIETELRR
ncbi:hypothetical protein [Anaerovibrio sp.]|uniref:hypothetical protein n=1 Tax=Anaerovibrio sp. TaxID=1872532 RepID=UPI001B66AEFA|nr:hypothetical protein [Anaerovibrio sp.]MBP3232796.1 hypothetical protein [Anaerovibrio sp.]MBR2142754.1 hypothetical protein [Anaerovibrio sp.]